MEEISGFDHYKQESAYEQYVHEVYTLLANLDYDYFKTASVKTVLDLVKNKRCKAFLNKPIDDEKQVKKHQSADPPPTGHDALTTMTSVQGHTPFNDKGQATVIKLFSSLKDAHESLAEVAGHVIKLGETTTHDQFSTVPQLAIRPLIQLQILGHLCSPANIKFNKDRLTEEETFEESCINSILLMPYHSKLSKIDYEHVSRCLAATIHMVLRKRMFHMRESQAKVAERFAVHPKKLHMACSGRKYDAGKKPSKKKQPLTKPTPKQKSTTPPEPSV